MAVIIPIDDALDPRISAYRQVRERDIVGHQGGFIAEGEVVLNVLARSRRHRAVSMLLAEKRIERLAGLIDRFADDIAIYSASQPVMDAIAGFHIHRGILALGRRAPTGSAAALLDEVRSVSAPATILVLFGIANHDNIGGIFRNAAAFGVSGVLLDGACCDPLYRKAIRVSVGGALMVPFARLDGHEDPLALLAEHGFEALALSPVGKTRLGDLVPPPRAAVMLGAEGRGLPAGILAAVGAITIPMADGFDSLNVATTSGIVLHHLSAMRGAS